MVCDCSPFLTESKKFIYGDTSKGGLFPFYCFPDKPKGVLNPYFLYSQITMRTRILHLLKDAGIGSATIPALNETTSGVSEDPEVFS